MSDKRYCQCYKSLKERDKCCSHPAKPKSAFCGLHQTCKDSTPCVAPRPPKVVQKRAPTEYMHYLSKLNAELKAQGVTSYKDRRAVISKEWKSVKASRVPIQKQKM